MRWSLAAVTLALVVPLAGCVTQLPPAPSVERNGGIPRIDVLIEVRGASVEPGRCFDGATTFGKECHVVRLQLTNKGNETVRTVLSWSAGDEAGGGASHGDMQGPSSILPGATVGLTVRFTTPEGSPRLTRIVFDGFPNAHGEADVPPY